MRNRTILSLEAMPEERRDQILDLHVKTLRFENLNEAYLYTEKYSGFLYRKHNQPQLFLWASDPKSLDFHFHFYGGEKSDFDLIAEKPYTFSIENDPLISNSCLLCCSSNSIDIHTFKEALDRLVLNLFGNRAAQLEVRKEYIENNQLSVFVVDGVKYCSTRDFVAFIRFFEILGLADVQSQLSKSFWDVDFIKTSVTIRSKYVSRFVKTEKLRGKVKDLIDHNYNPIPYFGTITTTTDMGLSEKIKKIDTTTWTTIVKDTNTIYLDQKRDQIYKLIVDNDLIILKAGTGCTKTVTVTKCLKRYLTECEPGFKVLFISNRIVYADSMQTSIESIDEWTMNSNTHEFGHINTASYTKYPKDIPALLRNDIILMSIESLMRLKQTFDVANNPFADEKMHESKYIIVLDEITETLSNVYRKTVGDKVGIFKYLYKLIQNAGKVVTMSDDMSFWAINILVQIRPRALSAYYEVTRRSLHHTAYFSRSVSLMESLIKSDIQDGKNLLIVCGQKARAESIKYLICLDILSESDVLVITSEENPEFMKKTGISEWKNYRVVIYSPKVTSGVSFNEDHFHRVYVFMWERIQVVTYKQMAARSRKLKDNIVFYCLPQLSRPTRKYSTLKNELAELLTKAARNVTDYFMSVIEIPDQIRYAEPSSDPVFLMFKDMFFETIVDRHLDYNSFEEASYKHIILECGNKLGNIDDLIDFQTIYPPTNKKNIQSVFNGAKLKLKKKHDKAQKMIIEAQTLKSDILSKPEFKYSSKRKRNNEPIYSTAPLRSQLEKYKSKKRLDENQLIKKKLYELVCYNTSVDLFLRETEEVIKDYIDKGSYGNPFNCVRKWNSIALPLKSQLFRYDFDITDINEVEKKFIDRGNGDDLPNIVIKIVADLFVILTGINWKRVGYESIIERIDTDVVKNNYSNGQPEVVWRNHVEEIIQAQERDNFKAPYWFLIEKTEFVYNSCMLLNEDHCQYLRDNIGLIHYLLYNNQSRDDPKKFANLNKNNVDGPSTYIIRDQVLRGQRFRGAYARIMNFTCERVSMVFVFTAFRKLLSSYFGVKLVERKKANIRINKANVDRFVQYNVDYSSRFKDYVDYVTDPGAESIVTKKVSFFGFDHQKLDKILQISKFFSILYENQNPGYEANDSSKRTCNLEKQQKTLEKCENQFINLETN